MAYITKRLVKLCKIYCDIWHRLTWSVCTGGRAGVLYVITKFSLMTVHQIFLPMVLRCARFAIMVYSPVLITPSLHPSLSLHTTLAYWSIGHLSLLGYWQIKMSQIKTCFHWSMIQLWLNLFPSWRPHVINKIMNFKRTQKLYIIKTCGQMLYFNSTKHHIQFQYSCRGWGLGVGHYPPKISSDSPRSMLLALPNFDQTMWFSLSYFKPDPKFYPQFQTLQALHYSFKTWWEQLPKKMLLGCVLLKVNFLTRESLKAYSLCTMHISLYISLFQIRKYSY